MKRICSWIFAVALTCAPALWGVTEIVAFHLFEGDRHGDFKGDLIVDLADGSAWKGHPRSQEQLSAWKPGEAIHISRRTSWYLFRRQHKFLLNNLDRKESVAAMLVDYSEEPLMVVESSGGYAQKTGTQSVIVDEEGNIICWDDDVIWQMDITLSDGSAWIVFDHFTAFRKGAKVYLSFNRTSSGREYFIITKDQREAVLSEAILK